MRPKVQLHSSHVVLLALGSLIVHRNSYCFIKMDHRNRWIRKNQASPFPNSLADYYSHTRPTVRRVRRTRTTVVAGTGIYVVPCAAHLPSYIPVYLLVYILRCLLLCCCCFLLMYDRSAVISKQPSREASA